MQAVESNGKGLISVRSEVQLLDGPFVTTCPAKAYELGGTCLSRGFARGVRSRCPFVAPSAEPGVQGRPTFASRPAADNISSGWPCPSILQDRGRLARAHQLGRLQTFDGGCANPDRARTNTPWTQTLPLHPSDWVRLPNSDRAPPRGRWYDVATVRYPDSRPSKELQARMERYG